MYSRKVKITYNLDRESIRENISTMAYHIWNSKTVYSCFLLMRLLGASGSSLFLKKLELCFFRNNISCYITQTLN
jgi:hypothetical protein